MRARGRMVWNTAWRRRERRPWTIVLFVAVILGMNLTYSFAGAIFDLGHPGGQQVNRLISGALTLLTGFTAVTSVTFALSSLYFSRDLELLLSTPIRPAVVVLSRMLTQLILGFALGIVIVGPPLFAYATSLGRPVAALLVGLAIITLAMTPLALATGIVVMGVRAIPARFVRDAGGLVVMVTVFAITGANIFLRGGDAFSLPSGGHLDVGGYGGSAADSPFQPIGWARRSISAAVTGDVGGCLAWLVPTLFAGIILLIAIPLVCERPYLIGFQRNAEASRGRNRAPDAMRRRRRLPAALALVSKDLRELRRDASQLGQLLLPVVLFAFYIGAPGHSPGELSGTVLPAWFGAALIASFASLFSASGLALRGIGSEGLRFWIVRTAPLGARQLMTAKFVVGFLVAFGLGGLLLAIGEVRARLDVLTAVSAMLIFAVLIAGLVGLAAGLGALRPRLDWTDPRRAVGIGTTLAFLGLGSVYIALAFVAIALPFVLAPGRASGVIIGDLALLILAALVAGGSMWAGARRLAVMEA